MQVEVQVAGLREAIDYIERFENRLKNRNRGLFKAVNRIADVWLDNFQSEGARVGRWDALADSTQAKRAAQGFSPDHPILERSGALKDIAVAGFTAVDTNRTQARGDSYSDQLTTSSIHVSDGVAELNAHGWKVANQERRGHPARPIWFVDKTVLFAARGGVVDWVVNDVIPD
jgi:hypothetical protein